MDDLDELVAQALEISERPDSREMDMLKGNVSPSD